MLYKERGGRAGGTGQGRRGLSASLITSFICFEASKCLLSHQHVPRAGYSPKKAPSNALSKGSRIEQVRHGDLRRLSLLKSKQQQLIYR